jgi:aryl-alcohol dehydrogenase-like predicted oxidoreductase
LIGFAEEGDPVIFDALVRNVGVIVNDFSETTTLGVSGLEVRRMGIGADSGVPAHALEWAFERGINFFYWGSRRRPGMRQAIRTLAATQREKMVIALQTYDPTGLVLERTFLQGLNALAIDYADVFILGMRNGPVPRRILDKALALQERGYARHLCVSAHDRSAYRPHLEAKIFDLIMVRYNAAHRGAERDVFPLLARLEREDRPGVICYNATRWGHLFDPRWMPPGERLPSPTDLYRYALSNPGIEMVLTAPETIQQLEENVKTLEMGPVSDEERAWLERIGDRVHALNPSSNFDFVFQALGPSRKR